MPRSVHVVPPHTLPCGQSLSPEQPQAVVPRRMIQMVPFRMRSSRIRCLIDSRTGDRPPRSSDPYIRCSAATRTAGALGIGRTLAGEAVTVRTVGGLGAIALDNARTAC